MNFNERIRSFQRSLARNGLLFCYWLFKKLPFSAVNVITNIIVRIGYVFIFKQRRIAKESLEIAFKGEKSPQEIRNIVKNCFMNFGQGMIEMLYYLAHPDLVSEKVYFEGKEILDKAMQQGKGVVAVTAHFGNFPLMMLYCAQQGYKVNSIVRPARDKELEKFLFQKRTDTGVQTVYALPRKKCVAESIKALRNNEILFIPLDQNFGSGGGIFVDFFGQKAATATGPVVFSQRTAAPIVPMFIVRQKDNRHKIIVEQPSYLHETKNAEEEKDLTVRIISKITALIEKYIRKYPQEWGWMHRRWKSRPNSS